jgi:hypothetical protein
MRIFRFAQMVSEKKNRWLAKRKAMAAFSKDAKCCLNDR